MHFSPSRKWNAGAAFAGACLLASLVGCSGFASTATDGATANTVPVHGAVHGGQQPVSGSHIYLYAVGTGGYGSAATSILTAQTGATLDGNGNYYVTTDASGNFGFANFTCPTATATQTYLLAVGGNPGLGGSVNNSAITALISAGKCSSINTFSFYSINELTTVAMVTALQQYMLDGTHIGGPGSLPAGLTNAFNLAEDLVSPTTGVANSVNKSGTGAIVNSKTNGIGNALAPCLNSASPTSSACASLFSAVSNGGAQPTDIVGAMLLIAKNPGVNAANIYGLGGPTPPFMPTINASAPPQDLTLAITYSGGGMTAPGSVVIDANGNAFMANSPSTSGATGTDSIVGFGPNGAVLTGATGYTSGIHAPGGLAIDSAGNIWSSDTASGSSPDQVVKLTGAGALVFAFNDANIGAPQGIAIDSSNNAWVANQSTFKLVKVSAAGADLSAVTSSGFYYPTGVGIDGSGNIFAAGTGSNTILKLSSAGTVVSPAGGYAVSGLNQPTGISVDGSGNVWTLNNGASTITKITNTGTLIAPTAPQPGISNAYVLSIDGAGGAWYANCRAACGDGSGHVDTLGHVLANQSASTGTADGYADSHLSRVGTSAVDGSGNVWVTNNANGTVTEFLGVAAPVVTPLAVAASSNKLGTRP